MEAIIYTRPSCDQWAKACSCIEFAKYLTNAAISNTYAKEEWKRHVSYIFELCSLCDLYFEIQSQNTRRLIQVLLLNSEIQSMSPLLHIGIWSGITSFTGTLIFNQIVNKFLFTLNVSISWFSYFCRTQQLKCIDLCFMLWNVDIPGFLWCFCSWRYW